MAISGSAIGSEEGTYTLTLDDGGRTNIDHWTIDWGDGETPEQVTGNPDTVSCTYDDGGANTITASVYYDSADHEVFPVGELDEHFDTDGWVTEDFSGATSAWASRFKRTWRSSPAC